MISIRLAFPNYLVIIEVLPEKKGKLSDLGLPDTYEYTMEHLEQDMQGAKEIYEKKTGKKWDDEDKAFGLVNSAMDCLSLP